MTLIVLEKMYNVRRFGENDIMLIVFVKNDIMLMVLEENDIMLIVLE